MRSFRPALMIVLAICAALVDGGIGIGQDWTQWGGSSRRNNVADGKNIPAFWNVGKFERKTGKWDLAEAVNIKWIAELGSQTYAQPIVAGGRIFIGSNNDAAYLTQYPKNVDLGCLLCFRESDGEFLWQYSSRKLATGRVHDWPLQGIVSAPLVDGNRLWFVNNRNELVCADTEGFYDDEDDGPVQTVRDGVVATTDRREADVVWTFDIMGELGVQQHNLATCCVTCWGDTLFVCTGNGVDESHARIPAPAAPSFIALDKRTGKLLWTDDSPGANVLHGQWSSPSVAELGGVPQVLFAGGDGWLYSFRADRWKDARPELLWKFDANPKDSQWKLGGSGTRNNIIAFPVIYDGLVYLPVGQDPEHGEGPGHLWCIDPTRRGDVSPELVVDSGDANSRVAPNPNSAAVWHYDRFDANGDGEIQFEEEFHRTLSCVAIKDDLLFACDVTGLVHCLNAKTGMVHWTCDLLAAGWGAPLIVDDKVYVGDEDGDVAIFQLSADPAKSIKKVTTTARNGTISSYYEPKQEMLMDSSIYSTPLVANGVLYIADRRHLYAIAFPPAK